MGTCSADGADLPRAARIARGEVDIDASTLLIRHHAQNTFLAAALVALMLIVFCSIAMLHFETRPGVLAASATAVSSQVGDAGKMLE